MKPYTPVRKLKKTGKKQRLSKRAKKAIKSKAKKKAIMDTCVVNQRMNHEYTSSEEVYFGIDEMDQPFT